MLRAKWIPAASEYRCEPLPRLCTFDQRVPFVSFRFKDSKLRSPCAFLLSKARLHGSELQVALRGSYGYDEYSLKERSEA